MTAKKRTKKQSLAEFRAWLEGVEELQPENWAPNETQWKLIRGKIDGIKEAAAIERVVNSAPNNVPHPQHALNPHMIPPAPALPSSIPSGPVTVSPNTNPLFNADKAKTITPDTATGDNSSFA